MATVPKTINEKQGKQHPCGGVKSHEMTSTRACKRPLHVTSYLTAPFLYVFSLGYLASTALSPFASQHDQVKYRPIVAAILAVWVEELASFHSCILFFFIARAVFSLCFGGLMDTPMFRLKENGFFLFIFLLKSVGFPDLHTMSSKPSE